MNLVMSVELKYGLIAVVVGLVAVAFIFGLILGALRIGI